MTTANISNPMTALRSGLPVRLRHLDDNAHPDGHCVYLLPGHAQRFAMTHAISLLNHLAALAIRREMEQEERKRAAHEARQLACTDAENLQNKRSPGWKSGSNLPKNVMKHGGRYVVRIMVNGCLEEAELLNLKAATQYAKQARAQLHREFARND